MPGTAIAPHELLGRRAAPCRPGASTGPPAAAGPARRAVLGLDAALRAETRAAVPHALAAQGTTAVLVTHDQAEALSMGREVGLLMRRAPGPDRHSRCALPDPRDPGRRPFVGEAVVVPGRRRRGDRERPLGELPLIDLEVRGLVDTRSAPSRSRSTGQSRTRVSAGHRHVAAHTFYGPDSVVQL